MDIYELLKKLTETHGPSGYETRIATLISELWEPFAATVTVDRIGSVLATIPGTGTEPRPRLLLAAHMDEIGLMVKEVTDHNGFGFLRVTNVGGVDIRHLYAQLVVIHGRRDLYGILGSLPARMLPEARRNKPFGYEDLVVDPGLPLTNLQELVEVGDFISFRQPLTKLKGKNVTGKALDNRASMAAVTLCLEELGGRHHDWDIVAVATAQEETRLLGAFTSTFAQIPDAAIAIDVTFAKGAGLSDQSTAELNGGPVIGRGPNVNPGMFKSLQDAAHRLEMDTTVSIHARASGTDAFGIQVARVGVPTGLVAIPLRYMHTMVETVNTKDIKRTGRLLAEFVSGLDNDFLTNIAQGMMKDD